MIRTPLWGHQRAALDFAAGRAGTLLAHEMGAGKTLTAIALLEEWRCERVLVGCPLSVVGVWPSQLARHTLRPWLAVRLDSGSVQERTRRAAEGVERARALGRPVAIVVNHEAMWREPMRTFLTTSRLDAMVIDESHRLKAAGGRASMFADLLSRRVPRRLGLTGTPMPHDPLDVYGQARFLDPDVFGTSFVRMRARYAVMGGYRDPRGVPLQIVGWQNMGEFERRLASFAHRVRTADVLDLPPEVDAVRLCRLEPAAARAYRSLARDMVAEVRSGLVTASNALVKLLRLQQLTGGTLAAEGDDGSRIQETISTAKEDLLGDVLDDLPADEPVVVFCRFAADLDAVRRVGESRGRRCGELSGRRKDVTEHGTMPDTVDLLAVQIQAGGLGVDLTRAAVAVYYSVGWSLGDVLQARARVRRPGQTRPVTHIHLICEGTVDQDVAAALERREDLVEGVLARMAALEEEGDR